jgi:hypothetical protein
MVNSRMVVVVVVVLGRGGGRLEGVDSVTGITMLLEGRERGRENGEGVLLLLGVVQLERYWLVVIVLNALI